VSENFGPNLFVKFGEFRQKLICDFNNPHGQLCTVRHYAVKGILWGLFGDWGLNWGLRSVSCSNLRALKCHPCACKLFAINFPLNS